jgi:excisionase family DNA binding protein
MASSSDGRTDIVWLGTQEAARRLGITTRTLRRLIDAGTVPAYRIGRVIRLQQDDLDRFLDTCRIAPAAERASGRAGVTIAR